MLISQAIMFSDKFLEEPILAMPYQFMVPILNSAPTVARPLKKPEAAKASKYLQLCQVLLARFPSDTSGRAVEFLMGLVANQDPGPLPPLPWFTTAGTPDRVQVDLPASLARVAPAMVFRARIGQ